MKKSKDQVLSHLQIAKLGKRTAPNKEFKGELPAIVVKRNGEEQYAAVVWDAAKGQYRITFDPAVGMSTRIECIFVPENADIQVVAETAPQVKSEPKSPPAPKTQKKTTKRK